MRLLALPDRSMSSAALRAQLQPLARALQAAKPHLPVELTCPDGVHDADALARTLTSSSGPAPDVVLAVGSAAHLVSSLDVQSLPAHRRWRHALSLPELPRDAPAWTALAQRLPRPDARRIVVFDFDGVLCDSAAELGVTAFLASAGIVRGADGRTPPSPELLAKFCAARPLLETGYEAIAFLWRLVDGNETPEEMLANPDPAAALARSIAQLPGAPSVDELKRRFQAARDAWIARDEAGWFAANGFFQPAVDLARELLTDPHSSVYVCTTKHASHALRLLRGVGVDIPPERVFGLGSGPKTRTIARLAAAERDAGLPPATVWFVEDRVETLVEASRGPTPANLVLAGFGYNTREQRELGRRHGFFVVDRAEELRGVVVGGGVASRL